MTKFLHGVEVIEIDDGSRPITTVKSAVIGLIGTAPDSAKSIAASLTIGTPILDDCIKFTAKKAGKEGNAISLEFVYGPDFSVIVTDQHIKVTVNVSSSAVEIAAPLRSDESVSALVDVDLIGNGAGEFGVFSKIFLSGGEDESFPLKKPCVIFGSRKRAESLGKAGSLPAAIDDIFDQCGALVVVVRVENGLDEAETQSNVIEGCNAFLTAQTELGYQPRILIAPEFSQFSAVASELEAKAKRLRAITYIDCERDATYTDSMKIAKAFGERVEVLWPWVNVFDTDLKKEVSRPYSGRAAGLRARIDAEKGFWWSKSNQQIFGIVGTSEPIDWSLSDPNTTANILNENRVSTIIREGGFKHWGNRTCSTDPRWTFEQTRRTADIINDSVERNHLWAVDRNITKTYIDDVIEGVNSYLRELKTQGAIIGGECWADKELNTTSSIQKGIVYFDFDFCPPYPAEHIIFRSRLNNDYLEEVFT